MDGYIEYASRPGHTGLSLITLGGLSGLAAVLWHSAPGYVILLLIPAILLCMYQTVVTPVFGVRMSPTEWVIMDGASDRRVAAKDIAYLRVIEFAGTTRASVVLTSGVELEVPLGLDQRPLDLIRDATNLGVPVRSR